MNPYQIRQFDEQGEILAEQQVLAHNYDGALRQLKDVPDGASRIEVFNRDGESAGETNVDFWRQKLRRR